MLAAHKADIGEDEIVDYLFILQSLLDHVQHRRLERLGGNLFERRLVDARPKVGCRLEFHAAGLEPCHGVRAHAVHERRGQLYLVDLFRVEPVGKLPPEVFGVDGRGGGAVLANVQELGRNVAGALMVVHQREQRFVGQLVRNRVVNFLGVNECTGAEGSQVKPVVVELQINLQLFHQGMVFLVAHLMKTKQRGVDVELLS